MAHSLQLLVFGGQNSDSVYNDVWSIDFTLPLDRYVYSPTTPPSVTDDAILSLILQQQFSPFVGSPSFLRDFRAGSCPTEDSPPRHPSPSDSEGL